MKKIRMRLVGEGDDGIQDWSPPIGDYHHVINVCNLCAEPDVEFPLLELNNALKKFGKPYKSISVSDLDDVTSFLESLLSPYLDVSHSSWGGDSPGQSGVFVSAHLQLGHTKEVRRILQATDDFIGKWSESSGLNAAIKAAEAKHASDLIAEASKKAAENRQFKQEQQLQEKLWEDNIFSEVLAAVQPRSSMAFCRFNFLVHKGVVFYLDRGWWHSTKGSVSNVAERLEGTDNVTLVRCAVKKTKNGWIPYFGRSREEELSIGWRETGIEITSAPEWSERLSEAMHAEKMSQVV